MGTMINITDHEDVDTFTDPVGVATPSSPHPEVAG